MPNLDRKFIKDGFYHIYNRGNHRDTVFFEPFDYEYFLTLADDNAEKYRIEIIAYCLMRNHVHFLICQKTDDSESISKWMGCSTMSYSHFFNKKYNQVGSVFQGRFKSKYVENDEYLIHLSKYIHNNPVEFIDTMNYRWSSIQSYINKKAIIANPSYILKCLNGSDYTLNTEVAILSGKRSATF
jgi:putative transposase